DPLPQFTSGQDAHLTGLDVLDLDALALGGREGAGPATADLPEPVGAADDGDPTAPPLDEVSDGEAAPVVVVGGDGAEVVVGLHGVDEDHPGPALHHGPVVLEVAGARRDEHAPGTLLLELGEVELLPRVQAV